MLVSVTEFSTVGKGYKKSICACPSSSAGRTCTEAVSVDGSHPLSLTPFPALEWLYYQSKASEMAQKIITKKMKYTVKFAVIKCAVFPLSRSARLALHSRGDLHVHGETAPVHVSRCDAGETAIRHPLPRGPSQRLRRLDNPTFPSVYTCPQHPSYFIPSHYWIFLWDSPLCSAAPPKPQIKFSFIFSECFACLSLLFFNHSLHK